MAVPANDSDPSPHSKRDDFWTGWWTFIGGPFLIIGGVHDLITGDSWWDYGSGLVFLIAGAVLWWEHGKIVWAHVQRSRRTPS